MNDDRKRDMLRELMQKLPRRIILSVFRWTNPIAMTSRIVSLLMSKPFGTKTLLQRVVMTLTGVSRTKEELRLATEAVPKSLRPVVHQFVNAWMHQHPPTSVLPFFFPPPIVTRLFKFFFCFLFFRTRKRKQ